MLTGMTERDWWIALEVFDAVQSSRGEPGHDDRKFLEAIHYFTVHNITWRLKLRFGINRITKSYQGRVRSPVPRVRHSESGAAGGCCPALAKYPHPKFSAKS